MRAVLLLKTHVEGYTKTDGTYVKPHEDKRVAARPRAPAKPKAVAPVEVPSHATQQNKSFIVKKTGRKWLTVVEPGRSFEQQLALSPETAHLKDGDRIDSLPVGTVTESSKYGTKIQHFPLPSGTKAINHEEAKKWFGWTEEKADDGYAYGNGFDKLRSLGADTHPDYKVRFEALNGRVKSGRLKKVLGYIADSASQGRLYDKGISEARSLGGKDNEMVNAAIENAKQTIAGLKAKEADDRKSAQEAAAKKKQEELEKERASGITRHSIWTTRTGWDLPSVGETINHKGEYRTVTEMSKGRYEPEASSFGGTDERQWNYLYKTRPATDEESAPLKKQEAEDKLKRHGRNELARIRAHISRNGERPKKAVVEGEKVHDTFDLYGSGDRFVIGKDHIWHVQNNGMDGDNWANNNVVTGGAGAIGARVQRTPELEHELRNAIRNMNGKESLKIPTEQQSLFGDAEPLKADIDWKAHHIPESNANYRTHKRQLDEMKKLVDSGDTEALRRMKFGKNTYGKRRQKLHKQILEQLGIEPLVKCLLVIRKNLPHRLGA